MRKGIQALVVTALVCVCLMEGLALDWHIVALDWLKELEAVRYEEQDPRYAPVPADPPEKGLPPEPAPIDPQEKGTRPEPMPPEPPPH